jgi:hypothetical protein
MIGVIKGRLSATAVGIVGGDYLGLVACVSSTLINLYLYQASYKEKSRKPAVPSVVMGARRSGHSDSFEINNGGPKLARNGIP